MGGLLGEDEWAPFGHQDGSDGGQEDETDDKEEPESDSGAGRMRNGWEPGHSSWREGFRTVCSNR